MSSWKSAAGILVALPAVACVAVTACSSSSGNIGTGCSGLSACCSTLSGGEAESCESTVSTTGITDAECNSVLTGFQNDGFCGGGGGGGGGGSGSGGCATLSSCCPNLPVSQDPSECLTVAKEGTDPACNESLATYQTAGYCESDAGAYLSVFCLQTDESECTVSYGSTVAQAMSNCDGVGRESVVVASCPTASLIGCCVLPPLRPNELGPISTCYYTSDSGFSSSPSMDQSDCASAMGTWSSTVPANL
jgi:hypothetical protein